MSDLQLLRHVSAHLGANPLLVQAAGGNTSLKQDGVMWIKASGTWLKDAAVIDIFVPVDVAALIAALDVNSPDCETCQSFLRSDLSKTSLRPSIETTVHALMPQRVVLHVHCVNTIAHAIRRDAEVVLAQKLAGMDWVFIPYARPGLELAGAIAARLKLRTDVLVLGNHGLVVAAESVEEAEVLLAMVVDRLCLPARTVPVVDLPRLSEQAQGTDYRLADDIETHALASDHEILKRGRSNVYYPDHVVFLGIGIATDTATAPPLLAVPGKGVLIHKDAKPAVEPMGRCFADVLRRVPLGADLRALSNGEIHALIHWEAEKYRQGK